MRIPDYDLVSPNLQRRNEGKSKTVWRSFERVGRELFRMRMDKSGARVTLAMIMFVLIFVGIAARLVFLALHPVESSARRFPADAVVNARPDIVDRNGAILATDVKMMSVYAEPHRIVDTDEAVELLTAIFPDINGKELRERLTSKRGFVWIKREVTPEQQQDVHRLGLPGIGFQPENKRIYPNGSAAAHVLGFADVDNLGIAGIEKYIDSFGLSDLSGAGLTQHSTDLAPVRLSLDLRVQHALRDELLKGLEHYKAKAAAGMIFDVETGEVVALASLPDFDPNNPKDALKPDRINRMIVGAYELGSIYKILTLAMGLESGKFDIHSELDAREPIQFGRFTISDFRPTRRVLTYPEVFTHSSNIGTAKIALGVGIEEHKAFLKKLGQLDRLKTELPESAEPQVQARWTDITTATVAYGHGIAAAPIQVGMAAAAMVNGGHLMTPTFLPRMREEALAKSTQVIRPETSEALRFLMRLNVTKGSAGSSNIAGYFVGAKTGTADKIVNGEYVADAVLTSFMAIAPADHPRYLFLTVLDDPQAVEGTQGFRTAGHNVSPITGAIIERVGPLLGLSPRFEDPINPFPEMLRQNAWGAK